MTPFARYFNLKDAGRDDFRLSTDVPEHLRLYVDLDQSLLKVTEALAVDTPLLVIEGDFGTGKSHLLRYVERVLLDGTDEQFRHFEPVYIVLSGFHRRSDFLAVHQQIAPAFIHRATQAMQAPGPDRATRPNALQGISDNARRAFRSLGLAGIGVENADATTARQWLMATVKLTSARMTKAGFSCTLFEEGGPSQIVEVYKAISELYRRVFGKKLLLLLDEGESFSRVVDIDAQAAIGSGMRTLFDGENRTIGCFLGLNTPRIRGYGVHPMLRSDVQSRVGNRQLRLSSFTSADRIAKFMEDLWPKLANDAGSLPFLLDHAAFSLVAHKLDDLRRKLARDEEELSPSPSPRDLLHVLSDIGSNALKQGSKPPIRVDMLRRWYGMIKV